MEKKMTVGREGPIILSFTLPLIASNLLQVAYNFVDTAVLGNAVSDTAMGAVGVVSSMVWMITAVCTALGAGVNVAASQYYGAGKKEETQRLVSSSYVMAILLAVIIFAAAVLLSRPVIAGFLQTPDSMYGMSRVYFLIYAAGGIFQLVYNVTFGILRSRGDSKGALLFLLVSAILNVGLDLLFVVAFSWGVAGAAEATIIAQGGSAAASVIYLKRRFPELRLRPALPPDWKEYFSLLTRLSIPIALQTAVNSLCFIILQRLINSYGEPSITGYTAMLKIEQFAHIPSQSFNVGIATFAGQNIGAGDFERAKRGYRKTLLMGVGICLAVSLVIFFTDNRLLGLFGISGEALIRGREHLELLTMFIWVSTITNITSGFLQGCGDVRIPALCTLLNLSIRLSLSYILAAGGMDYHCYFYSMPPAWIAACLLGLWRYRSGRWRKYRLVS